MAQPPTIYKSGKLNYVWNYLSSTLDTFKAKLLGYRSYVAIVTQVSTDPPTAVVLENSLGEITFTYDGAGYYIIHSANSAFTVNKTIALNTVSTDTGNPTLISTRVDSSSEISILGFAPDGAGVDGLTNATIEIRVYNYGKTRTLRKHPCKES